MDNRGGIATLTIGVAGGSGSGKSTVVDQLTRAVGPQYAALVRHDEYYREYPDLSIDELRAMNWDHPDVLDTGLMVQHLRALKAGRSIERPQYDFATYSRSPQAVVVEPRPVLIVEGIMILVETELRDLLDIKVYVDTDPDIRFIRRLTRDVYERQRAPGSVIEQYKSTVRPMHLAFVEPSKRYADLIIPWSEDSYNRAAITTLVGMINASLRP